jgi:Universal stress protein family
MIKPLLKPKKSETPVEHDFKRILVPVCGKQTDEGAIALACSLAGCKSKKTIIAVHVIPVERCLPLDAEIEAALQTAESVITGAEQRIQKFGHMAMSDILQAREIGPALIEASIEHMADLILISLNCKTAFGEFYLGNVVPHILKNAPCRVILNYEAGGI